MCVGGYNLSAGSRNNKKKPSLPNFLCYTAKRAVLCKTRYEDIDNQNSAPQCLGNLAINDLLFLSVREARLLKIIAGSSNDPPLGNRSEIERERARERVNSTHHLQRDGRRFVPARIGPRQPVRSNSS